MSWPRRTPRTAGGRWNATPTPRRARSSMVRGARSVPANTIEPLTTSYPGIPMMVLSRVVLPLPLGPMSTCVSAAPIARSIPWRISRPPTRTWRSCMTRSGSEGVGRSWAVAASGVVSAMGALL